MKNNENVVNFLNDEINRKILQEYLNDSRQSYREISRKLGVAPGTIITRMKHLEENGLIKKFTVQINLEKMGYIITAITHMQIRGSSILEKDNILFKLKEANAIYKVTGGTDIIIIAKLKTTMELDKYLTKLNNNKAIRRTHTYVVLDTIKEDFNHI
ncbi:Lrp/AsnC family transcriptional regulator [Candidatus Bathyarchaeota archaeon]|nr:Lrp/AsnC family transcriptional regulator [Candidatus Bathyarchaeota archaeon]